MFKYRMYAKTHIAHTHSLYIQLYMSTPKHDDNELYCKNSRLEPSALRTHTKQDVWQVSKYVGLLLTTNRNGNRWLSFFLVGSTGPRCHFAGFYLNLLKRDATHEVTMGMQNARGHHWHIFKNSARTSNCWARFLWDPGIWKLLDDPPILVELSTLSHEFGYESKCLKRPAYTLLLSC
jgi:hypothetical protein